MWFRKPSTLPTADEALPGRTTPIPLPERHEAVLRAKYLDGRTVREIVADWGETEKAVESLLTRARDAFRAAYERSDHADR